MTDKTKEALKLALDWIEGNGKYDAAKRIAQTIREALAEEFSGTEQPINIPLGDMNMGLQWDEVPQAFNDWWNSDYDPTGNPFKEDSKAYWAWAGWKAATDQPAIKQDLTPEQNQCKFPLCHNEEYQQALAEQIKRGLYTGETAQQEPVAWPIDGDTAKRIADRVCVSYETVQQVARELAAPQPAQQQEPHGYLKLSTAKFFHEVEGTNPMTDKNYLPLYTSPPASKPWVGLTEKEKREARNSVSYSPLTMTMGEWTEAVQDATEAKLREKNA